VISHARQQLFIAVLPGGPSGSGGIRVEQAAVSAVTSFWRPRAK